MPRPRKNSGSKTNNGATVGYEAQLWQMADALRGSMDAAEYKHVVLGLIFLKYISDAFEEVHARLTAEMALGADPEDPDEYRAVNILWVPTEARWPSLKARAKQSAVGRLVDDAMAGIERDNPALKGVLPKDYARPALDKERLGQLIDLVSNIKIGDEESRSKDVLAGSTNTSCPSSPAPRGKKGGEFYTPLRRQALGGDDRSPTAAGLRSCCGSSGMFVQSVEFIRAHAGETATAARPVRHLDYGQESNYTPAPGKDEPRHPWYRGQIAHGDTFHSDRHPDLKADFILANPPFNISDWGGERLREDKRWEYVCRRRATPLRRCSTSSTTWRPRA